MSFTVTLGSSGEKPQISSEGFWEDFSKKVKHLKKTVEVPLNQ